MHEEKHQELGRPCWFLLRERPQAGRFCQPQRRQADDLQGVGLTHSTLRAGEPSTWGRGQQWYVACKGNIDRTVGTENQCKPHYKE